MDSQVTRLEQVRAFTVHLLTASGALWAFLSIIAVAERRWVAAFAWLGIALFVDGIDGPIARRIDIKRKLPDWSGDLLDSIIDYVTYVIIPAFALYQSGLIGPTLSFLSAALIVLTSAIYYADTRMKTKGNFFRGFPVAWNMLVFTVFAVKPNEWISFGAILLSAILTFMPVWFLHPVRVVRLRAVNLSIFAIWSLLAVVALMAGMAPPAWAKWGLVASSLYLYAVGGFLQTFARR
ncbi:phosphatidylcholine synthase [Mangrovibrevibacter kandeliae]|uniref:phosphatidylcholine synthase n=1 Tax=Mangrovibrevibacter kandeliae TaxID=2968473 RepID=UPI002118D4EE|nr:phosphatidylcholine/phosphatidylserine synthase [Aurantimonas sp. CSK15Z-1]MCQ8782623.1 phosphatidylcholine/phosphatidylserine synthase [Aurantimonas sp. CSK15Z-1]